jgi:hypothetical protein
MKLKIQSLTLRLTVAAGITACTIWSAGAQNTPTFITPGAVAPKMMGDAKTAPKDREWANVENFGTIPARLRNDSVKECAAMGSDFKPMGYHPDALDYNGKLIAGGGYLCLTQEKIDQIRAQKK